MSYLLKAMKKAEQERQAVQEQPMQVAETKVVSAGLPLPLVAVVLFVCAVVLAQVFSTGGDRESQQGPEGLVSYKAAEVASIDKPQESLSQPKEIKAVADKAKTEESVKDEFAGFEVIRPNDSNDQNIETTEFEPEANSLEPQAQQVKQLEQLSKAMLSSIPSMQLESHIYSSAESFRSVVINGRSFNQGDYFSPDVVLHQITEDGVVIQVNGELVAMPKGISWVASNGQ